MNKQRLALITAAAVAAFTISCAPHARVGVYADVPGPPSLAFETAPYLVPLPGTYVYAVPDYDIDLYYADGYYWRPWQGRWYRSTTYDRGWVAFSGVPYFYTSLPRNWRDDYRSHRWRGHRWDYARVPHHEVERNWSTWKRERRWADDQRRYTGDRRWHDDDRRQTDRRDWNDRDGDRRAYDDRDRRDADLRERSDYDGRRPDGREADRRVYETREGERRVYSPQPVERRAVEGREIEVRDSTPGGREPERRVYGPQPADRREIERRNAGPVRREAEPRPVRHGLRKEQPQQVERDGRGPSERREVTPQGRGRGPVVKDENRDGIDDSLQRRR